jgi:hypothetical protein
LPTLILIVALAVFGAGSIVAGIFVLFGVGWSLILGGILAIAAAAFLRRGLTPNG